MWIHMSPNGRICCISLYKQAKRAYLDRLKVKKDFYAQVSDYTIIAASLIPLLPSIVFPHLLSSVTTVDLLTLLKYSRKPQACHFGHNLNLFSHLGRKCVNILSVSIEWARWTSSWCNKSAIHLEKMFLWLLVILTYNKLCSGNNFIKNHNKLITVSNCNCMLYSNFWARCITTYSDLSESVSVLFLND